MKSSLLRVGTGWVLSWAFVLALQAGTIAQAGGRGIIQVYAVKARKVPGFMGPAVGELKHRQEVWILGEQGAFVHVKSDAEGGAARGGVEGWVPKSALTTPEQFKIRQGNQVQLSKSGAMAAGKGLNEAGVKSASGDAQALGQKRVDEVEAMTPDREGEVEEFVKAGGLKAGRTRK